MQGWDYRLGINGVKRMQSAYNSALVAQGAFSAYWTDDLRAVGGWPDAIGEDIVLTWTLMDSRGIVQYEPCALAFTAAPRQVVQLMRQRSRWARGMFESLGRLPPRRQPRVLAKLVSSIDYLVPLSTSATSSSGSQASSCSCSAIRCCSHGGRCSSSRSRSHLRPDAPLARTPRIPRLGVAGAGRGGFLGYLFLYQAITSTAALRGYAQHVVGAPDAGADPRRHRGRAVY